MNDSNVIIIEDSHSESDPKICDSEIKDNEYDFNECDNCNEGSTNSSEIKAANLDKVNEQPQSTNLDASKKISMSYLETDSISNITKTSPTIKTEIKTIASHRKVVKRKVEEPNKKKRGKKPKNQSGTISEDSQVNQTPIFQEQELEDFLTKNVKCAYSRGDIVWAKIHGYSFWPAMIDNDPDINMHFWIENSATTPTHYHVVFFDAKNRLSRSWCKPSQVRPYGTGVNISQKQYNAYKVRFRESVRQADEAMAMSVTDRIKRWSFLSRKKIPGTHLCHD